MQTTRLKETASGAATVTYADSCDITSAAQMVAEHPTEVSMWDVIMSIGGSCWPLLVSFDFDNLAWLIGSGETCQHIEYDEVYVLDQGSLISMGYSGIYSVLKRAARYF